jgi:hypothetical protein
LARILFAHPTVASATLELSERLARVGRRLPLSLACRSQVVPKTAPTLDYPYKLVPSVT